MIQQYNFCGEGPITFDDSKSVEELIQFAFDKFGYYEPFGMKIVTIFQPQHPDTNVGWFTTDTNKICAEEIKDFENLCFAYYLPGVLYFAEGGWGHHMISLGNHPSVSDPVALNLRFEDFHNTVVIAGKYTFRDIIRVLREKSYISMKTSSLLIRAINPYQKPYEVSFDDSIIDEKLTAFDKKLPQAVTIIDII